MTEQNILDGNEKKTTKPPLFTAGIAMFTFLLLFGLMVIGTIIGIVRLAGMLFRLLTG